MHNVSKEYRIKMLNKGFQFQILTQTKVFFVKTAEQARLVKSYWWNKDRTYCHLFYTIANGDKVGF